MGMVSPDRKPPELVQSTRLDPPGTLTATIRKRKRRDEGFFGTVSEYFEVKVIDCTTTRYMLLTCEVTDGRDLGVLLNYLEDRAKASNARFAYDSHDSVSDWQIRQWRAL
jgi:hypothetical protein